MKKVFLFGAMLLALTTPIAAQAQQNNISGGIQTNLPGGIFIFTPGVRNITPMPPYGWDDLRGGYPIVQARLTVNKITVHPGDTIYFDYHLVNSLPSPRLQITFGSPQWEEAWLIPVEEDPKVPLKIILRLLANDPANNPGLWKSTCGIGPASPPINYYLPVTKTIPLNQDIHSFAAPITIPKDIKRGQYIDLCVATTPNGFPVNERLQPNGFPIGTIGWAKVRLYVE